MTESRPVVGVDFSGSQSPGRSIWITEGTALALNDVEIESINAAADLLDATGREEVLEELVSYITQLDPDTVVGLDFPFGLPVDSVDADSWREFLTAFHDTFEGRSIESFPGRYERDGTRKRETDFRYAGQSPFSPQIRYQVFYGLRDVLYPLVDGGDAVVVPMQETRDDATTVVEIYPAAAFGRLCCYRTGYKGNGDNVTERRDVNLKTLESEFGFQLEDSEQVIENDDALDSLCAACTAARVAYADSVDDCHSIEGHIFA